MKKIVLFDIDYTLFNTDVFKQSNLTHFSAYSEVSEILKKISEKAEIGVFSEGENTLQQRKLEQIGLLNSLQSSNIHIFSDKLSNIEKVFSQYSTYQVYMVDDKLSVLFEIKKSFPRIITVWLKRGKYAQNQKPIPNFQVDFEITNLEQILSIV